MEADDDMFEEASAVLEQTIVRRCTVDTDISNLYRSLLNRQFHLEAPLEFTRIYPPNDGHYVETCMRLAKQHDMAVDSVTAIISIGVTHKTALALCRRVARHFGKTFDLETFCLSDNCMEEGEIEEDVSIFLREIASQYLYPVASYSRVRFA